MYYRQPRYFKDFRCIGGECKNTCCTGWTILWSDEEINKIKNAENISDSLSELCNVSFKRLESTDSNCIVFDKDNMCPFFTEERLCRIQRELGEEYLSDTCKTYPRRYIHTDDSLYRFCQMSCPSVMYKLLNDGKSADLVNFPLTDNISVHNVVTNSPQELETNPETEYRGLLLEFFYEIVSDKKNELETCLILGAMAAQQLSELVENKQYDKIPETVKSIRAELHSAEKIKYINNIAPNYGIKLNAAGLILDTMVQGVRFMVALTDETRHLNKDLYDCGERSLADGFKDRPFYLRNIALNLILELALPFYLTSYSIFENYSLFVLSIALIKLTAIASMELINRANKPDANVNDIVSKAAAIVCRSLCHNQEKSRALIETLKNNSMLTIEGLAGFIK